MNSIVVIIPVFNAERTIERAILSVLDQQEINFKILLIDHGSTDKTYENIKKYLNNDLLEYHYLARTNEFSISASFALNYGLHIVLNNPLYSTNFWFFRLDSDDFLINPHVFKDVISSGKGKKIISTNILFFEIGTNNVASSLKIKPKFLNYKSLIQGSIYSLGHHGLFISIKLLKDIVTSEGYLYDIKLSYGEDLDLSYRLISLYQSEPTWTSLTSTIKTIHNGSITNSLDNKIIYQNHYYIFQKHLTLNRRLLYRMKFYLLFRKKTIFLRKWILPGLLYAQELKMSSMDINHRLSILNKYKREY